MAKFSSGTIEEILGRVEAEAPTTRDVVSLFDHVLASNAERVTWNDGAGHATRSIWLRLSF
jgi:hypothetical protein